VATTAAVKAAATTVKAATAMESAATVETISTMETATVEAISATESTAVETAATKAVIKATATVEAAMKAPIKETVTVPEAKAPPGSGAEEDSAIEPFRAVIPVGGATVGIIAVIAIGADRRWAVIDRPSKSNSEGDALGVRI
jgi:hypothetical protein